MRVFFKEVVFDFPGIVKPQTICQLHLLQRFLKQLLFSAIGPRAWQLMLIENTKLHRIYFKLTQSNRNEKVLVKDCQRGVTHCDRRCVLRRRAAAGPTSYGHSSSRKPERPSAR